MGSSIYPMVAHAGESSPRRPTETKILPRSHRDTEKKQTKRARSLWLCPDSPRFEIIQACRDPSLRSGLKTRIEIQDLLLQLRNGLQRLLVEMLKVQMRFQPAIAIQHRRFVQRMLSIIKLQLFIFGAEAIEIFLRLRLGGRIFSRELKKDVFAFQCDRDSGRDRPTRSRQNIASRLRLQRPAAI